MENFYIQQVGVGNWFSFAWVEKDKKIYEYKIPHKPTILDYNGKVTVNLNKLDKREFMFVNENSDSELEVSLSEKEIDAIDKKIISVIYYYYVILKQHNENANLSLDTFSVICD